MLILKKPMIFFIKKRHEIYKESIPLNKQKTLRTEQYHGLQKTFKLLEKQYKKVLSNQNYINEKKIQKNYRNGFKKLKEN